MTLRIDGQVPSAPIPHQPVRVLRVEAGQTADLWSLSPDLGGLFTHFASKRSHYCPGATCGCPLSRVQRVWKGYIAALHYVVADDSYHAVVLEVSEHAELDMRGRYQRGQMWRLQRPAERRGRHGPVVALLSPQPAPVALPQPFCVEKVLRHLYHCDEIDLRHKNPLPDRVVIAPISASALKSAKGGA